MKKQEKWAAVFFIMFITAALVVESNLIISTLCLIVMCIAVKAGRLSHMENSDE